jgi:hypothetical protein
VDGDELKGAGWWIIFKTVILDKSGTPVNFANCPIKMQPGTIKI